MAERTLGVVNVVEYPPDSGNYLFVEETKRHKNGRLNYAGGGLNGKVPKKGPEKEETIFEAGSRELTEESGLEGEIVGFLGLFDYRKDGKIQIAVATEVTGGELEASDKHPFVGTFSKKVVKNVLAPAGMFRSERTVPLMEQHSERKWLDPKVALQIMESDVLPEAVKGHVPVEFEGLAVSLATLDALAA